MDITELAEKLRPFHYDFLVFDACFMSSIEVLYEMRNSFDYIVSSPTEVLATGFPYKEILPELLSNNPNYNEIVEKYIAKYNEKKGILKSASMTVVKTSGLNSFSESLKVLINNDVIGPDLSTILQYDQEATSWLFDIGGVVSLFKDSEKKELVKKLLSDMIVSYNHTDMFYNKIPLKLLNKIKKKIDENLVELEKKNKDFSFNFKIKNMKKKKENIKKNKMVAIFLDDIYNILNRYERFFSGEKDYQNLDKDFLFIKTLIKLSKKFNFMIPMLGRYGEKISDKFVTLAFFNNINDVDIFLENMVYNVSDIHIIKNKYKIFRNSDIKKEMIFLNNEGKIEKKNVTYIEFLDCKYRKKYRINKKNSQSTNIYQTSKK